MANFLREECGLHRIGRDGSDRGFDKTLFIPTESLTGHPTQKKEKQEKPINWDIYKKFKKKGKKKKKEEEEDSMQERK